MQEEYMELVDEALLRIRVEYIEMPDLKLTGPQARRFWNLSQEVRDAALASLVRTGFLWRTPNDQFLRHELGREGAAISLVDGAGRADVATESSQGAVLERPGEPSSAASDA